MREGPSDSNRIKWVYQRRPAAEVLASFENWRRVKDMDGESAGSTPRCCRATARHRHGQSDACPPPRRPVRTLSPSEARRPRTPDRMPKLTLR